MSIRSMVRDAWDTVVWFTVSVLIRFSNFLVLGCLLFWPHRLDAQTPTAPRPQLIMSTRDQNALADLYRQSGSREFGACLLGQVTPQIIRIVAIGKADISDKTDSSVTQATECSTHFDSAIVVGFVHSHPDGVNCSHFLFVHHSLMGEPAESVSATHIGTSDYYRFKDYTTAPVSMIYCGDKVAILLRSGNEYVYHIE